MLSKNKNYILTSIQYVIDTGTLLSCVSQTKEFYSLPELIMLLYFLNSFQHITINVRLVNWIYKLYYLVLTKQHLLKGSIVLKFSEKKSRFENN